MNQNQNSERYVGIDVSRQRLDIAVGQRGETWSAKNQAPGIDCTVRRLQTLAPALVVVESTGGLEQPLVSALQQGALPVAVIHPQRMRLFARALGYYAKTDQLDARVLAMFAFTAQPKPKIPLSTHELALSSLVRRRSQVQGMLIAERNRRRSIPVLSRERLEKIIALLAEEQAALEAEITTMLGTNADFVEKAALLQSAKGVGPILSATLLSELPELGRFSHKQIAALVGVAPYSKDSGNRSGKRHIKGGRQRIRNVLYMATLSAIKSNPVIRTYYQQLVERGKLKKVAIVACMRKLLVILNAMMRDQQPWRDPVNEA